MTSMDKINISLPFLEVLEEIQHAVMVLSRSGEIIWSNNVSERMFDLASAQKTIVRKELLRSVYEQGEPLYEFILPTLLGFPVSFALVESREYQVLISSSIVRQDIGVLRQGVLQFLEFNLAQFADELCGRAETLYDSLKRDGIKCRDEQLRQLRLVCKSGEEFQSRWKESKKLLDSFDIGMEKTERVDVIKVTEAVLRQLQQSGQEVFHRYHNSEYGVIYGDCAVLTDTIRLLVSSSLSGVDLDSKVLLSVYQGVDTVMWQWECQDDRSQLSARSIFLWGLQGGEVQRSETENCIRFRVRILCGGAARRCDNDLALWSDNELLNTLS